MYDTNRPSITVTLELPTDGDDAIPRIFTYELSLTTTVESLKQTIAADAALPDSFPTHRWTLFLRNQRLTADDNATLAQAGIQHDDFLGATPEPLNQPSNANEPPSDAQIEQHRQRCAADSRARAVVTQNNPILAGVIDNPAQFREIFLRMFELQRRQNQSSGERQETLEGPDTGPNARLDPETAEKLREMYAQQRRQEEYTEVVENFPELITGVTMLYVRLFVNGHKVDAFVDSGAQATILSPTCAKKCGLEDRIDTRWAGVARGVGTAKVLGRIMKAPVRFNFRIKGDKEQTDEMWDEVQCSFTVMEGKDVDMLLGLDMLKRHRACIDLKEQVLRFGDGQEVPFLSEGQLPKHNFEGEETEVPGDKPALSGPSAPASSSAQPSSSAATAQPGNFGGQGRTLGSGGSSTTTPAASNQLPARPSNPTPATASSTNPSRLGANMSNPTANPGNAASGSAANVPDVLVNQVVQIAGCSRDEATVALRQAGGNLDAAVGIVLDFA
ncbi:MAG: DNA damage-inducible protein 1 [Alyxoria varia]|nr:MAG: DNA damage-inducible protein 1 [Alyxoria varia]